MRKAIEGSMSNHHAAKHLFCIDSHSMLIIFSFATLMQFLLANHVEEAVLSVRGALLVFAFFIYVLGRAFKKNEHLVIIAFSIFVFFRTFIEDLITKRLGIMAIKHEDYWVIIFLFICTGIGLKWLLIITSITFIGLTILLVRIRSWAAWAVDVPLFLIYSIIGIALYYTFFSLGTEICRLKKRPLRALRDLPSVYLTDLETPAFKSLPPTALKKEFRREEHLYILFRLTQVEGFRNVALQLIGEDSDFESTLGDAVKLQRSHLRRNLVLCYFNECPNPTLRFIGDLIMNGFSEDWRNGDELENPSNEKCTKHGHSSPTGKFGVGVDGGRQQIRSFAKKIPVSRQPDDGFINRKIQQMDSPLLSQWSLHSADASNTPETIWNRSNSDDSTRSKSLLGRTVTVGRVTFPAIDVHKAAVQARAEISGIQLEYASSSQTSKRRKREQRKKEIDIYRRGLQCDILQKRRNLISKELEHRLKIHNNLLHQTSNPMWDPISIHIDSRIRFLKLPWVQKYMPCLASLARWLKRVESLMSQAQWRHHVHTPKSDLLGQFSDAKIERWFLAWLAPVQARQHILLSSLAIFITIIINLFTWDLFIVDSILSKDNDTSLTHVLIYLAARSICHLSASLGTYTLQSIGNYKGTSNAHYFKRRAAFLSLFGLGLSVLDAVMHRILLEDRPLQIQFIILSLLTVPLFSQLKTVSNLWISFFFSVILLCILPIFILYETSAATAIEAVILLILGAAFYLTFLSRCLLVNYRNLFCLYALPYLLYLDALAPYLGESSDSSSDSEDTDDDSDSSDEVQK